MHTHTNTHIYKHTRMHKYTYGYTNTRARVTQIPTYRMDFHQKIHTSTTKKVIYDVQRCYPNISLSMRKPILVTKECQCFLHCPSVLLSIFNEWRRYNDIVSSRKLPSTDTGCHIWLLTIRLENHQ